MYSNSYICTYNDCIILTNKIAIKQCNNLQKGYCLVGVGGIPVCSGIAVLN